ncbi:unnamed protein product [Calypogeia fissa]
MSVSCMELLYLRKAHGLEQSLKWCLVHACSEGATFGLENSLLEPNSTRSSTDGIGVDSSVPYIDLVPLPMLIAAR